MSKLEKFGDYMISYAVGEVHVDFDVYEINGYTESPTEPHVFDVPNYTKEDSEDGRDDFVTDPAKADKFLHGGIKWDGCSNWWFDEQEKGMLHFCGKEGAAGLGALMQKMYEITAANLPTYDKKLGG